MWLKLDLDGIIVSLRIRQYVKTNKNNWDFAWCNVDFAFISEPWLNYVKEDDELLLSHEVDNLSIMLEKLLNNKLFAPAEFDCVEPDFCFKFNPKENMKINSDYECGGQDYKIEDVSLEWRIFFWLSGIITDSYLSVSLGRFDIECFLTYLKLVTGQLFESDAQVQKLIAQGIIY